MNASTSNVMNDDSGDRRAASVARDTSTGTTTPRRRGRAAVAIGVLALAGVLAGACSSSSSSSSKLTAQQRTELGEIAKAYDEAESATAATFEPETTVPRLEKWQESEDRHQDALKRLRDGLPAGACRSSIEALLVVEDGQNVIRRRLIEDYRQSQFGIVAKDTVDYAASVANGALQAEAAVPVACGRSTVDRARTTDAAASLTPAQNALFNAVLDAYEATRQAFDAAFSIPRFVTEVEALQAADVAVASALDALIADLSDGACRSSLLEVRELERRQSEIRMSIIAAGKAGDAVKMFTLLADYTAINSTSEPFVTARRTAVKDCGGKI